MRSRTSAALFAVLAAFMLSGAPAAAAQNAPATSTGTGTVAMAPRVEIYYYSEPAKQNLVGVTVIVRCLDYPDESWGVQTEWFTIRQGWIDCPSSQ